MTKPGRSGSGGIALAAVALALAFAILGCGGHGAAKGKAPPGPAAGASGGESIYDLDLPLTDQDGRSLRLADLRGSVLVAAMMYTSCKSVCPRVTEDMKGIQKQLGPAADRVRFTLFSLDPGRDTPVALRAFARAHGLDLSRWRLLAASEDGVRDLAAVLGVKYRPAAGGQIAHSAMIFLIDRDGIVRHRQVGLGEDPGELLAAVRATR